MTSFAFSIDPNVQILHNGEIKSFETLLGAVDAATDGDTIMLAGEVASITVSDGLVIKKDITFSAGKDFGGNKKFINYTGTNAPLFTVESGAVLTITDAQILGQENATLLSGACVYVKKGGTLVLSGNVDNEVFLSGFKLTSEKSKGGAVYCEKGGKVIVNGAIFTDNSAAKGTDIYIERKSDLTLADNINVNVNNRLNHKFTTLDLVLFITAILLLVSLIIVVILIIKNKRPRQKQFLYR